MPAPIVEATGPTGTVVGYTVSATDDTPPVTIACTHADGATFPLGTTIVTCTAVDRVRNRSVTSFPVVVRDTIPPAVHVDEPSVELWPPNGKLVSISFSGTAVEVVGLDASRARFGVVDEYGQFQPEGSVSVEATGAWAFTTKLEASRLGGDRDGRTYTITVSIPDTSGNVGRAQILALVPHDSRR